MKKFVFKEEWYNAISELPDDVRLELYDCIMVYAYRGEVKGLKSKARIAFSFIKQSMDEDIRFKKELSKKRSEAGKIGLKARWDKDDSKSEQVIANDSKNSKCYKTIANASKSSNCYNGDEIEIPEKTDSKNGNCYKSDDGVLTEGKNKNVPIEMPTEPNLHKKTHSKNSKCYDEEELIFDENSDSKNSNCYQGSKEEKRTKKEEKISSIVILEDSNNLKVSSREEKEEINKEEKEEKLKSRQKKLYDSLVPYLEKYDKRMIRAFYDYWSEPNRNKTKMRCELEKTWELSRRLKTWSGKDYGGGMKSSIGQQNQQQAKSQFQENSEQLERVKKMLNGE